MSFILIRYLNNNRKQYFNFEIKSNHFINYKL